MDGNNTYKSPLTDRYAGAEMSFNWSPQHKHSTWRRLWVALAESEKELGLPITEEQINQMKAHLDDIDFEAVSKKEAELRHDVMSHIHVFGAQCPAAMPIIHLGATSCFVTDNTEIIDKAFSSAAYGYLAKGRMLCTVTTPDVRAMFLKEMVNNGWTEEEAENDLKMIPVPRLPVSGDLTSDAWQDTIEQMDTLTTEVKMMGGMNGYGISAYTKCPNASLAFIEFAASYEQVVLRNEMCGITPARSDAAATVGEHDAAVEQIFANLDAGLIDIMPAINEVGQIWTPAESFLVEVATDALNGNRGEPVLYDTLDKLQAGLERLCEQIHDAIFTLA